MSKLCTTWLFAIVIVVGTVLGTSAQTFTTLVNFDFANGASPYLMSLVQAADGNYYGTTQYGGNRSGGGYGNGEIFGVSAQGKLRTLPFSLSEGGEPVAGLTIGTDGNSYGTTLGTIFKLSPSGIVTTLYDFCSQPGCGDGRQPYGALLEGADGNLYGTTNSGGAGPCSSGCGTIFKVTTAGEFKTLHEFVGAPDDGSSPYSGLVQGTDGNFYGTTLMGGLCTRNGSSGCGTVYKVSPTGRVTILHSFTGSDGQFPAAPLVQASDGNFYGTTQTGGLYTGTVFRVSPQGILTTLQNFDGNNGAFPTAGLIQATDGNFYSTAGEGGAYGNGTIFTITPEGVLTTLHDFDGTDGKNPDGGLIQGTDGVFYGATFDGGSGPCRIDNVVGCGTAYSLSIGLAPFVAFVGESGRVKQSFGILGQGFTGTTAVSLNGTPASFIVVSDTFIKATVPAGATTGYVTVTTPSGTLTSNKPFVVIP